MSAKFYCDNKECKKAYYFEVPNEIMIDEINLAVFFCPFCSGRLMRSLLPSNFSKYKLTETKCPTTTSKMRP